MEEDLRDREPVKPFSTAKLAARIISGVMLEATAEFSTLRSRSSSHCTGSTCAPRHGCHAPPAAIPPGAGRPTVAARVQARLTRAARRHQVSQTRPPVRNAKSPLQATVCAGWAVNWTPAQTNGHQRCCLCYAVLMAWRRHARMTSCCITCTRTIVRCAAAGSCNMPKSSGAVLSAGAGVYALTLNSERPPQKVARLEVCDEFLEVMQQHQLGLALGAHCDCHLHPPEQFERRTAPQMTALNATVCCGLQCMSVKRDCRPRP